MKDRRPHEALASLAWLGFVVALGLFGVAAWFHDHLDPIIRIPFVFFFGGIGLVIGLGCLGYIVMRRG